MNLSSYSRKKASQEISMSVNIHIDIEYCLLIGFQQELYVKNEKKCSFFINKRAHSHVTSSAVAGGLGGSSPLLKWSNFLGDQPSRNYK